MAFKGSFEDYHKRTERESYDHPSLPDKFFGLSGQDWEKGDMATFAILGVAGTQGEETIILNESLLVVQTPEIFLRFGPVLEGATVLIERIRGHLEVVMTECEVD